METPSHSPVHLVSAGGAERQPVCPALLCGNVWYAVAIKVYGNHVRSFDAHRAAG